MVLFPDIWNCGRQSTSSNTPGANSNARVRGCIALNDRFMECAWSIAISDSGGLLRQYSADRLKA